MACYFQQVHQAPPPLLHPARLAICLTHMLVTWPVFFFWSGILWKTCGKDKSTGFFFLSVLFFFLPLPHPFRRTQPEQGALVSDSDKSALSVTSLLTTVTTSSQFDWISFRLHCVLVSLLYVVRTCLESYRRLWVADEKA